MSHIWNTIFVPPLEDFAVIHPNLSAAECAFRVLSISVMVLEKVRLEPTDLMTFLKFIYSEKATTFDRHYIGQK